MLKKTGCIICMIILNCIFSMKAGYCSADYVADVSQLYQETIWINLDIPIDQRAQIDEIIVNSAKQVKSVFRNNSKFNDLDSAIIYTEEINNIRINTNRRIAKLLSPEQQKLFEHQLEKRQRRTGNLASLLTDLRLSKSQQSNIIMLMKKSQERVWDIVANTSIPWEERIKLIKTVRTIEQIEGQLTKKQLVTWSVGLEIAKFADEDQENE